MAFLALDLDCTDTYFLVLTYFIFLTYVDVIMQSSFASDWYLGYRKCTIPFSRLLLQLSLQVTADDVAFQCIFYAFSFFPLDVLDEIWDLIEAGFEGFLTFFLLQMYMKPQSRIISYVFKL